MGSITLETVRRDRSLKRGCATLVLKMVNSSSSCWLPPTSEHHSLSCSLHWECGITATKLDAIRSGSPIDRRDVRQHLSFESASIATYCDIVTVDTNHKAFSLEQGVTIADVPDRSHRSCATRRGTPGRSVPESLRNRVTASTSIRAMAPSVSL